MTKNLDVGSCKIRSQVVEASYLFCVTEQQKRTMVVQQAKVACLGWSTADRVFDPAVRTPYSLTRIVTTQTFVTEKSTKFSCWTTVGQVRDGLIGQEGVSRPEDCRPRPLRLGPVSSVPIFMALREGSGPLSWPGRSCLSHTLLDEYSILAEQSRPWGAKGKRLCCSEVGVPAPRLKMVQCQHCPSHHLWKSWARIDRHSTRD